MKRFLSLMVALLVCLSLACPAFAAETTFVPSITYKDEPDIEDVEMDGENAGGCLVVSSISDAKNKSTDISQEDRDLLLDVYDKLEDGSMKLPLENDEYVIRELVDVSFKQTTCVDAEHGHKEWLAQEGNTISVTFDLGVARGTEVVVLVYIDGEWKPIESVVNNGDGTVTCVFEDICPVAFCVESDKADVPAQTGDTMGQNLILWVVLMVASLAAIIVLMVRRRKHA